MGGDHPCALRLYTGAIEFQTVDSGTKYMVPEPSAIASMPVKNTYLRSHSERRSCGMEYVRMETETMNRTILLVVTKATMT